MERVAISVVVNFEEGAELQVGDGDPASELVGEVMSVVPKGQRDLGQEQILLMAPEFCLWRFLDALKNTDTPATFYMCGRAVERSPQLARAVSTQGTKQHVMDGYGARNADYTDIDSEKNDLIRAGEAIKAATGQKPVGFFCRGSESSWTRKLLANEGYIYTSNAF